MIGTIRQTTPTRHINIAAIIFGPGGPPAPDGLETGPATHFGTALDPAEKRLGPKSETGLLCGPRQQRQLAALKDDAARRPADQRVRIRCAKLTAGSPNNIGARWPRPTAILYSFFSDVARNTSNQVAVAIRYTSGPTSLTETAAAKSWSTEPAIASIANAGTTLQLL